MPEEVKVPYHERFIPEYNVIRTALLVSGFDKFVELSEEMYDEFKKADGCVTCEHSTKSDGLDLKMKFLSLMSMQDEKSIGYWRVYWCDTCEDHNHEHPFHCELMRNK